MNQNSTISSNWTVRIIPWVMVLLIAGLSAGFILLWVSGNGSFLLLGIYGVMVAALLFFCEFSSINFIASTSTLTVRRVKIWRTQNHEIRLAELHSISVERSTSLDSSGPTYRVVLITNNGDKILLTGYSGSRRRSREKLARKLHQNLSLNRTQPINLALDGNVRVSRHRNMRGEDWTIDYIFKNDSVPVTRWHAACHGFSHGFLMVVPASSSYRGSLPHGMLGKLVRKMYDQYLQVLDLGTDDLPGFEHAEVLQSGSEGMPGSFTLITSSPNEARAWMDRKGTHTLNEWEQRNVLNASKAAGEAHVLMSSQHIYLALHGCFNSEEQVNEIARLGTSLIET